MARGLSKMALALCMLGALTAVQADLSITDAQCNEVLSTSYATVYDAVEGQGYAGPCDSLDNVRCANDPITVGGGDCGSTNYVCCLYPEGNVSETALAALPRRRLLQSDKPCVQVCWGAHLATSNMPVCLWCAALKHRRAPC